MSWYYPRVIYFSSCRCPSTPPSNIQIHNNLTTFREKKLLPFPSWPLKHQKHKTRIAVHLFFSLNPCRSTSNTSLFLEISFHTLLRQIICKYANFLSHPFQNPSGFLIFSKNGTRHPIFDAFDALFWLIVKTVFLQLDFVNPFNPLRFSWSISRSHLFCPTT